MAGSADLAGSNLTLWSGCKDVNVDNHDGNYVKHTGHITRKCPHFIKEISPF